MDKKMDDYCDNTTICELDLYQGAQFCLRYLPRAQAPHSE